jgi:F-type H+-transporting ATPase subunit a
MGETAVSGFKTEEVTVDGKSKEINYVCHNELLYELESASTADFGLFGGGITSFYDFSITKNVAMMLLVALLLGWMFFSIARSYKKREGMAPKGMQSFIEPIYNFIRDDVAKAMIGPKYERFMPFIMAVFFFILVLNLIGQIPFAGNPNVTGNLGVTLVLAIFTFLITNLNGNGHYWKHILWMPGIPTPVKLLMTPIEVLGLFLKPITLMVRLFANITAGHIVVLSFVGLIFIFGQMGTNAVGGYGGAVISVVLTLFMSAIELLVAFIQAFIFAILSASYIGMAVADDHH